MVKLKNIILIVSFLIIIILILKIIYYKDEIIISFVGDIKLDKECCLYVYIPNSPGDLIDKNIDPFKNISFILEKSDFNVCNLEYVITNINNKIEKRYNFKGKYNTVKYLKKYFNLINLANNHSFDYGSEGLIDMLNNLKQNNLNYIGADYNLIESKKSRILNFNNLKIGFLSYNEAVPRDKIISEIQEDKPGILWTNKDNIKNDILTLKKKVNIIICYYHYGYEYEKIATDDDQINISEFLIDNGVDIVIGSHSHMIQNIRIYKNKPIFYSLGNFIFCDHSKTAIDNNYSKFSYILQLYINQNKSINWIVHMCYLNDLGIPQYMYTLPLNYYN